MLSVLDILEDTTVDGPGFRTTIYCAGCPNRRRISFTFKPVKTACQKKYRILRALESEFFLCTVPLIESFCRYHTAPVQHAVPVSLLLQGTLRPGIDQQPLSLKTRESPLHLLCFEMIFFRPENNRILGRAYIPRSISQFSPQPGHGLPCSAFNLPYRIITHIISSTHLFMPPSLISSSTKHTADNIVSDFAPNTIIIQLEQIFTCHCKLHLLKMTRASQDHPIR